MSEPQQTMPALGGPGEPCPECGAALAVDQRYCLNCGARHGGPRVDYRQHLNGNSPEAGAGGAEPAAAAPAPVTPAPSAPRPQRDYAPLAAAGGIAVLGIMLLIGVLIGRGTGTPEPAPAPQVLTVPSGAEASGGTDPAEAQNGGGDAAGAQAKSKSKKAAGGKSAGRSGAVAGGSADTGNAPVASDDQLRQLQEQSPEEYQDSSAKLPNEIATPGEAPPTDGKAPGGGSGGMTIE